MKAISFILFLLLIVVYTSYYIFVTKEVNSIKIQKDSIDKLVVYKSKHQLLVYSNAKLIKTYKIAIGQNSVGDKEFEGDKKTPEGNYTINSKNPNSGWHKNLGVSYPNNEDIAQAKSFGKPVGGDIKIHALRNGLGFIGKFHRSYDWTNGCIAVTNEEVDELYDIVKIGAVIEIQP